jgi:Neprosin
MRPFIMNAARVLRDRTVYSASALAIFATLTVGCGSQPQAVPPDEKPTEVAELSAPAPVGTVNVSSAAEVAKAQTYLDSLYAQSDVQHTFTTKFNEVIDCIPFKSHPSVKAAAKSGIALADEGPPVAPPLPPSMPAVDNTVAFNGQLDSSGQARACPKGTVPYRRVTLAQVQGAGGLDAYLWAQSHQQPGRHIPPASPICGSTGSTASGFSWALGNAPLSNLGGTVIAAVYNPGVTVRSNCGGFQQQSCEHSLSQVWATTGTCEYTGTNGPNNCTVGASGNAIQSVELGWHVDFGVEGDANTHLFSFSTQNGYDENITGGGCYNTCSFVPTSSPAYMPGQTISGIVNPFSGKAPLEYAFQVFNPGSTQPAQYQNWYVYVNGALIGYYPGNIFSGAMVTHATDFEMGGEVFSDYANGQNNNDVQMGSGLSPNGNGFTQVAYQRSVYYLNTGTGTGSICGSPFCSGGYCYNAASLAGNTGVCGFNATTFFALSTTDAPGGSQASCWGPYFYYGGGI